QKSHVDHSISPRPNPSGQRVHMGQFSVKIWGATGSLLSGNQHTALWLQTMVVLTVGDTVELQGSFRAQDGYFAAEQTSFWGAKIG
ncbi:hypothetical protein ACTXGA_23630, partial [Antarctobacter jejuensis]